MTFIKWGFLGFIALMIVSVFHYSLPQHDVVRITGTEIIRQDFSGLNRFFYAQQDSGTSNVANRDLRLINSAYDNNKPMVFRNEDTGFGWPFFFKFDSSNIHAVAEDLKSTREAPQWVVIRHYGWRNEFLSIYPNVTSMWAVDGPDVRIIPWFKIIFFFLLLTFLGWLRRLWVRFREARIDPVIEDVSEAWDVVDDKADAAYSNASGFFSRMKAKLVGPKR
ncbi:MAG: DUF1523 family protein [Halocynthiibacter sp.]